MTTVEGRDTATNTSMALAAIEQMFDEAMTSIGVLYESFSAASDEENTDDKQNPEVEPVPQYDPTEEIASQPAA